MSNYWRRLIVALDLEDKKKISKVVNVLSSRGVKFKIGAIAFTKFGPDFVRTLIKRKIDIFLDLKLYDIPNTMMRTAAVITQMGCWAFTVHLAAGEEALKAVKREVVLTANKLKIRKPLILGVTVLTSQASSPAAVMKLVCLAHKAGLDGVIASPQESAAIKARFKKLKVITPGIRSSCDAAGDQKRIAAAQFALTQGKSDYIVVGRPILNQQDYLAAARSLLGVSR